MKVNFNAVLKNLDGTEMEEPQFVRGEQVKDKWQKVTLGILCSNAVGKMVDDEKLPFKERDAQGGLAVKIYEGEHDLSADEVVTIQKMCAKLYVPLICHQIGALLDPKPKAVESKGEAA